MSNRLRTLVAFIQAITDQTIEQVAGSVNYSRVHLTKAMQKPEGNATLEKLLSDKYRKQMEEFFQDKDLILAEDQQQYTTMKVVDAEELLVHDMLLVKGMLRVVLRNQASIIAGQEGVFVSDVLKKIAAAVRVETKEEFDEL